jgi:hypothetical protein
LRYGTVFTMLAGAVVGATLTRFAVAPVIALAACVVAGSLVVFRSGHDNVSTQSSDGASNR